MTHNYQNQAVRTVGAQNANRREKAYDRSGSRGVGALSAKTDSVKSSHNVRYANTCRGQFKEYRTHRWFFMRENRNGSAREKIITKTCVRCGVDRRFA